MTSPASSQPSPNPDNAAPPSLCSVAASNTSSTSSALGAEPDAYLLVSIDDLEIARCYLTAYLDDELLTDDLRENILDFLRRLPKRA